MKRLVLTRWASTDACTIGRMGQWYTLENPWRDNQPNVSCIPAGVYICKPGFYNRGNYPCWDIEGVPGRSLIKFHIGNRNSDTEGCILLGERLGVLGGDLAVLSSGSAFNDFMESMKDEKAFELEIRDYE